MLDIGMRGFASDEILLELGNAVDARVSQAQGRQHKDCPPFKKGPYNIAHHFG